MSALRPSANRSLRMATRKGQGIGQVISFVGGFPREKVPEPPCREKALDADSIQRIRTPESETTRTFPPLRIDIGNSPCLLGQSVLDPSCQDQSDR